MIKFIRSQYSNNSDQCTIERGHLKYMFRRNCPSKAITKEILPSFLWGHASPSSRKLSNISPPPAHANVRETNREEMNHKG